MYLIKYFCKHRKETKIIAACADKRRVSEMVRSLNNYIGYESGMGLWGQDADGYYTYHEVRVIQGCDLESNFMNFISASR